MLYLLPNLLGPTQEPGKLFAPLVAEAVSKIDGLIAESEKAGRQFLKLFKTKKILQEMPISLLNEHTPEAALSDLLAPIQRGEIWGLISDAGLPCLADPGSGLVLQARMRNIPTSALPGPSSITQALMLSGLPGQYFTFHGYLPKGDEERKKALLEWQRDSKAKHSTELFIETPYRNGAALSACLEALFPDTFLTIACDLTLPSEYVETAPISYWRKKGAPDIAKRPAIFLFNAGLSR